LKVSDIGRSAPLIGTSRISIADSPESFVNILNTRMQDLAFRAGKTARAF
jgi:hypothetical protein